MKIAYFSDTYIPTVNGVTTSVKTFGELFSKDHRVVVYVPDSSHKRSTEKNNGLTIEKFPAIELPNYKGIYVAMPNLAELYKLVEQFDPDIIHVHTPGPLGIAGVVIAKRLKKPLVGTYHTLFSETLSYLSFHKFVSEWDAVSWGSDNLKHLFDKIKKEISSRRNIFGWPEKRESVLKRLTWFLVNNFYNYCDVIISPSEAIKRELLIRAVKKPVKVVSNGVDVKMFPKKTRYNDDKILLHVGRLGFEKNVDVVIKAFSLVIKKIPSARLVIAGDGPARKGLEKLAEKLGSGNKISFLGMVERGKLAGIYRSSSVFVTASTSETQGLVTLEAMASGLPVVGVNKFATADLIDPGQNGYLVSSADEKKIASRVIEVVVNSELQKKMGTVSRAKALTHDIKVTGGMMEEIYESMVSL